MVADKQEKADPPSDAQLRREVQPIKSWVSDSAPS